MASAGAIVGAMPFGTAVAGIGLRPMESVEVGLNVGIPFPLFDPDPLPFELQPGLSVKISP